MMRAFKHKSEPGFSTTTNLGGITKSIVGLFLIATAAIAFPQAWTANYEKGIENLKQSKFAEARKSFILAKNDRKEDTNLPTVLPLNDKETIQWRNGSLYSPNFLAAYCMFHLSEQESASQSKPNFKECIEEFESILKRKQVSAESMYFLAQAYSKSGQVKKANELANKYPVYNWKVDAACLNEQEKKSVSASIPDGASGPIKISQAVNAVDEANAPLLSPKGKIVPYLERKFALIITNGATKGSGLQVPYAQEDGRLIKDSLSRYAGYKPDQVELITEATAVQIESAAKKLAAKMPQDSTLFLFYTGAATQIDGTDWIAGVDTGLLTDTSSMVKKLTVYEPFIEKGIKIFAFYQVSRMKVSGKAFGAQEPKSGAVSQMQSTIEGEEIFTITKQGKQRGIFADGMIQAFEDLCSNSLPITDFGWQIFYKMKRGGTATTGGSSRQTPTLPVLLQMGPDTRF